jgi:hypothetical protein
MPSAYAPAKARQTSPEKACCNKYRLRALKAVARSALPLKPAKDGSQIVLILSKPIFYI